MLTAVTKLLGNLGVSDNDSHPLNISLQFNIVSGIFKSPEKCKLVHPLNMHSVPIIIPSNELIFDNFSLVFVDIINFSISV